MANALLLALTKGKGKGPMSPLSGSSGGDDAAPESKPSGSSSSDYKQIAKDAAKDGDWDAMIDAICGYVDSAEGPSDEAAE